MGVAPVRAMSAAEGRIIAEQRMILHPPSPVRRCRAQLVGVDAGVQAQLGDSGRQFEQGAFDLPMRARRGTHHVIGEHGAFLGSQATEREARDAFRFGVAEAHRQPEVDGQLEVHVEEVGTQLEGGEMAGDVADVEAPHDRPFDLGPTLPAHLVEVGVIPCVFDGARESAVSVEQARRRGDGPPAVGVVLGVEGEVHPDVLAAIERCRVAGPGARHHQRRAGRHPDPQRLVDRDVARRGEAEVVARDEDEHGVGRVSESLGESGHPHRS